jgi:two-component system, OmpR family, sensor histidine kinase KdpD
LSEVRTGSVGYGRRFRRVVTAALVGPALVTSLALLEHQPDTSTAALVFVLAVVAAAGYAGQSAGLGAALTSFLSLNFFFTAPLHTLKVSDRGDLIALIVFLAVSIITGVLFSRAVHERERAERREEQARLTAQFTNRLLSGVPVTEVMRGVGQTLTRLLDLARCEIKTIMTDAVLITSQEPGGEPIEVELRTKDELIGMITATPSAAKARLESEEKTLIESVGAQLSLALESSRLTDEVRSAQLDAETNRLRAALFSGVTHDLKTPLAVITASVTSLLEGPPFNEEQRYDHLDTIRQEADHLNRVVTNLMDLARLRAGALVPKRVPAAIDELIEAVVSRNHLFLTGRDVEISLKGELPEMMMDVVQIDQVLTNLLENAVKFTPAGSPIHITAGGGTESVRVTVSDRGSGIPPADRERVFQPFERGQLEVAGTGLGLAIARAAVLAHGGKMWAQDAPGGGAAVTFELPTSPNGKS